MYNDLKKKMEKEFDKNYEEILSKIENKNDSKKLGYLLIPTFVLVMVIVFAALSYTKNMSIDNEIAVAEGDGKSIEVELNINKLNSKSYLQLSSDLDVKEIKIVSIPKNINFINQITLPENLKLASSYAVYTNCNESAKESIEKEYDILHDYVFLYATENNEKTIKVRFSEIGEPLRDYEIDDVEEKSKISDTEFEISEFKDMYIVVFSYNGVHFDIETKGITKEELLDLLISMIKN